MNFYISFGQEHAHSIDGITFDKDSLMLVTAPNELCARRGVNQITGGKWSSLYHEEDVQEYLHYFPRGIVNRRNPIEVFIES